jgi:hypothetical protein
VSVGKKKKPARPRRFQFYIGTWRCDVAVQLGGTPESANRHFGKLFGVEFDSISEHIDGRMLGLSDNKNVGLWFRDEVPELGTLAHEALHATCHILRLSGVPLTIESEEAYTYLQGYIIRKIAWKGWAKNG